MRHDGLSDLTEEIEHASKNISFSLHIAALLVCGAILFLADSAGEGGFGVLSVLGSISVVLGGVVAAYRAVQTTFR